MTNKKPPKLCEVPSDIPTEPHWAIITGAYYYESSGYEKEGEFGETRKRLIYRAFFDEEEWKKGIEVELRFPTRDSLGFFAFKVEPSKVEVTVSVKVG